MIGAVKIWGHLWSGKRVAIYCDNEAVVQTITNQKPSDKELQDCLREFLFHVSVFKFQPVLLRVSSEDNFIPDFLSRNVLVSRNHNPDMIEKMFQAKDINSMKNIVVDDSIFNFVGDW